MVWWSKYYHKIWYKLSAKSIQLHSHSNHHSQYYSNNLVNNKNRFDTLLIFTISITLYDLKKQLDLQFIDASNSVRLKKVMNWKLSLQSTAILTENGCGCHFSKRYMSQSLRKCLADHSALPCHYKSIITDGMREGSQQMKETWNLKSNYFKHLSNYSTSCVIGHFMQFLIMGCRT